MIAESFEKDGYKIKKYELKGYFQLDFMFKNERFMGFVYKDQEVIEHDYELAKSKIDSTAEKKGE